MVELRGVTALLLLGAVGLFAVPVLLAGTARTRRARPPEYAYGGAGVKAYSGPANAGQQGSFRSITT